ncbi:MAG: hypothetical protein J07HQW2_01341 [Haloquadratum walsbyi J07HQW2]|uniref:Uncharacterized protein n=2 Tax=Haloquadratum walsbyi TaxID=293091 RepID=U1MWU5_9EURY|nr:MAG: hypothetical protein J07HQW2_01341 [Haloquadratum walsbyi J07HQW2]
MALPYISTMAVRPPQQDDDDPDTLTFGIAALDAHLSEADLTFPATTREVVLGLGDPAVPYDASGSTVSLSEAFDDVEKGEFDNKTELLNALHPVFEEYRVTSSGGFLKQLRAMLPF